MPDRIRPRRPIAWNQLLMKGHAHQTARSAERRQQRQLMDSEIDDYFFDFDRADESNTGADCDPSMSHHPQPNPGSAKDGAADWLVTSRRLRCANGSQ